MKYKKLDEHEPDRSYPMGERQRQCSNHCLDCLPSSSLQSLACLRLTAVKVIKSPKSCPIQVTIRHREGATSALLRSASMTGRWIAQLTKEHPEPGKMELSRRIRSTPRGLVIEPLIVAFKTTKNTFIKVLGNRGRKQLKPSSSQMSSSHQEVASLTSYCYSFSILGLIGKGKHRREEEQGGAGLLPQHMHGLRLLLNTAYTRYDGTFNKMGREPQTATQLFLSYSRPLLTERQTNKSGKRKQNG